MGNMRRWQVVITGGACAGCVSLALGLGVFQEDSDPPQQGVAQSAGRADEPDRGEVRARLVRRLELTRERIARYEGHASGLVEAISRLDAGEQPEAVYETMRGRAERAMSARDEAMPGERRGVGDWGGRRHEPLDAKTRQQTLDLLATQTPALQAKVTAFQRSDSEQMDQLLRRLAPKLTQIREAQQNDPEMARLLVVELYANLDLTFRSRDLRQLLADETPDDGRVTGAREGVREALRASFDAHLALKEHEVRQVEGRLRELREEISKRQKMRDDFIERQFERIGLSGGAMFESRRRGPRG